MLTALIVAAAILGGAPLLVVGIIVMAAVRPGLLLAAVLAWAGYVWLRRRSAPSADDEAQFLLALAAEMRSGASLRSALRAAAHRVPRLPLGPAVRKAGAGLPMAGVAGELRASLPVNGRHAAAAVTIAASTGAAGAGLFTDLAVRAARHGDVARERRALTAQGRLSAAVVAAAPTGVLAVLAASGGLSSLGAAGGLGPLLLVVGLALELLGVAAVWWIVRRSQT